MIINVWRGWMFETVLGEIFASLGALVLAFIVAVMMLALTSIIATAVATEFSDERQAEPIYALRDNVGQSGQFFLGCGSVDSELKYFYVVDTSNGKHVASVPAARTYIAESNVPTITTISYDWANKSLNWIAFCMKDDDYIFSVPPGTILNDYEIDLR